MPTNLPERRPPARDRSDPIEFFLAKLAVVSLAILLSVVILDGLGVRFGPVDDIAWQSAPADDTGPAPFTPP